jgi:hypothetical protein
MVHARLTSMTALALLHFVLAGLVLVRSLVGYVTATAALAYPLTSVQGGGADIAMLMLLSAMVDLGIGLLGMGAGLGLLKVAPWGWDVALTYAIAALLNNGLGVVHVRGMAQVDGSGMHGTARYAFLALEAWGWFSPVLLLMFLHTAAWKQAFAVSELDGLNR